MTGACSKWRPWQVAGLEAVVAAYPDLKGVPWKEVEGLFQGHTSACVRAKVKELLVAEVAEVADLKPGARSRGGKRADLGDRYFRSGWEANYARYLNWLTAHGQIDGWEYEPRTFEFPVKRGTRFYTPDFLVHGKVDEWHEVKGYLTQKGRTALKRFQRYYPEEKLVLIDSEPYRALSAQVSRLIEHWE